MAEYIEREAVLNILASKNAPWDGYQKVSELPAADVQPVVRCKDCKYFHLNYFEEVNGVNIIVAHEICDFWAGGCKTVQNAFCSKGVRKDSET